MNGGGGVYTNSLNQLKSTRSSNHLEMDYTHKSTTKFPNWKESFGAITLLSFFRQQMLFFSSSFFGWVSFFSVFLIRGLPLG